MPPSTWEILDTDRHCHTSRIGLDFCGTGDTLVFNADLCLHTQADAALNWGGQRCTNRQEILLEPIGSCLARRLIDPVGGCESPTRRVGYWVQVADLNCRKQQTFIGQGVLIETDCILFCCWPVQNNGQHANDSDRVLMTAPRGSVRAAAR